MHDDFRNEGSDDVFRDISVVSRINTLHQKIFEERDSLIKVAGLRLFLLMRFELRKLVFYRFQPCFDLSRFVQKVVFGDFTIGTHLDQIIQALLQLVFSSSYCRISAVLSCWGSSSSLCLSIIERARSMIPSVSREY